MWQERNIMLLPDNHILSHSVAFDERPDENETRRSEIEETQSLIGTWPDQRKLISPFGKDGLLGPHLFSNASLSHLCRDDYTTAIWNLVPGDWRKPYSRDADCLAAQNNANWPVVVLYDTVDGCLVRLPDFLTRRADFGISIEQVFPDSVIVARKDISLPCLATSSLFGPQPGA
jgi:hypothetical protein